MTARSPPNGHGRGATGRSSARAAPDPISGSGPGVRREFGTWGPRRGRTSISGLFWARVGGPRPLCRAVFGTLGEFGHLKRGQLPADLLGQRQAHPANAQVSGVTEFSAPTGSGTLMVAPSRQRQRPLKTCGLVGAENSVTSLTRGFAQRCSTTSRTGHHDESV